MTETVPFAMTDTLPFGTLRLPARVHVGFGARQQIPALLGMHGARVLAVVDPFLVNTPIFAQIREAIAADGMEMRVFSDVKPELPVDSLIAAASDASGFDATSILAIGGGSALDAAKLIALLLSHGGPLSRFYGENLVPGPVRPIIAVPTTAGTGSEVTPVAVVSDPARSTKVGISSAFLVPSAAVVDPELMMGAPASVTAHSGIDALVHAMESYTAAPIVNDYDGTLPVFTGRNALTAPLSLDAAHRIHGSLALAVSDPTSRTARAEMAVGSLQAGIAFGSTGTHLCHALQYPIGSMTQTPHGLGTGLLLPYMLDVLSQDAVAASHIAELGQAMGAGPTAADAVDAVVALNRSINIPSSLSSIGVEREQLGHIADIALQSTRLLLASPVPVTHELLLTILENAFVGTPAGVRAS